MEKWNKKVIFLDFDGVIRVQMVEGHTIDKFEFCPERINYLASICKHLGAKIVLSTDWRHHSDVLQFIPHLIPYLYRSDDPNHFKTPVKGQRWYEIQHWMDNHDDVKDFVILDDWDIHFDEAPDYIKDRLILCDHLRGVEKPQFDELERKLLDKLS